MKTKGIDREMFAGRTVSIIGGGPSLKGFDFDRILHPRIGINNAAFVVKCDLMVAIDKSFIKNHKDEINQALTPLVTKGVYAGYPENVIIAQLEREIPEENEVRQTVLSGPYAMMVALTLGARRLVLFGFDGGFPAGDSPNWYRDRKDKVDTISWRLEMQNERYAAFKDDNVVNVGLGSLIDVFPRIDIRTSNFYAERVGHTHARTYQV